MDVTTFGWLPDAIPNSERCGSALVLEVPPEPPEPPEPRGHTAGNAPLSPLALDKWLAMPSPPALTSTPIHVLLVEDDPAYAFLVQETLRESRHTAFRIREVARLSQALSRLETEHVDVVLLDLSLPDSSGIDSFTTLHDKFPDVPVVVLSGLNDETIAVEAVHAGAQDYLVKGQVEGQLLARALRYAIERQRAEVALRQQRDWFEVTLSSVGDAVIATDTQGTITFMNPIAEELTGWPVHEACGRYIDEVFRIFHEHTRQPADNPVPQVLRQAAGAALAEHTVLQSRDGREIPIADSATPIRSGTGTLRGAVLVFRDISERHRLEERLRQAYKMEAIGTLAGGIAHDFNNILGAILGYTEIAALDVPPASPTWSYLQHVLRAGVRAKTLVRQILAFSRPSRAVRQPVALTVLIKEALDLLRASIPSTIALRPVLATPVGAVLADPTQMHQVVMNLCANAEYAMRQSGGVIEVRLEAIDVDTTLAASHPDLKPGPYVRLTVQDSGPGIAPDVLPRLFEPYFTTKEIGEGAGMGLAMVHGIVVTHEGAIVVSSVPGQGTTFEVYLPRITATPADDTPSTEAMPGGAGRILLVDDEVSLACMGQVMLERLGYQVTICLSSVEALEVFSAAPQHFDLILTDQTMPGMTGDTLAGALRRLRPDIPIILCTGFSHTITAEAAALLGIDAWLDKPWQMRDLAATIQRVLVARQGQAR